MSLPAIEVSGLSKRYVIQHESRHDNLRDTLHHTARKLWRRVRWGGQFTSEEFWALHDVSFRVQPGEVVGIIGRNGAGKSTLLKILSRITEPTTGKVKLRGRVASLLEVGTGFHPELSGRENIFLNGAILGMSRAEIRRKFDEIVAFAEVERFLDTPVKRYSSGMYVRLAFAVAAHLEPEILIVDEVLAVGDSAFQKKCLGKMQDVSRAEGRSVLFVSHNLSAIRQLCNSAVLLAAGSVQAAGPCQRVLEVYQHGLAGAPATTVPPPPPDILDRAYATRVDVETIDGKPQLTLPVGQPWRVRVAFKIARSQKAFVVGLGVKATDGISVQTAWLPPRDLEPGDYEAVFTQDRVVIEAGTYLLRIGLSSTERTFQQFDATRIDIVSEGAKGFFPVTSGVGLVLNSMETSVVRTA
jgi:lipopolysaccharide transport system ATP-binding protein